MVTNEHSVAILILGLVGWDALIGRMRLFELAV